MELFLIIISNKSRKRNLPSRGSKLRKRLCKGRSNRNSVRERRGKLKSSDRGFLKSNRER
jgi:hypothetical protein